MCSPFLCGKLGPLVDCFLSVYLRDRMGTQEGRLHLHGFLLLQEGFGRLLPCCIEWNRCISTSAERVRIHIKISNQDKLPLFCVEIVPLI